MCHVDTEKVIEDSKERGDCMSEQDKRDILERVAALPQEDQRNLAFFVAGMAAKTEPKDPKPKEAGDGK